MSDCYCDYEPPEFWTSCFPTARKQHRCEECSGVILPGERYNYVFGKWEGECSQFKVCERCHDLRQWVQNNIPCLCWAYGRLFGDCRDAIEYAYDEAPEEVTGLRFGFERRVVQIRKFNAQRGGNTCA
jgi:hypothetical protein